VENASLPNSSVAYGTRASLPRLAAGGPVVILIGEVYREAAAAHRGLGRQLQPATARQDFAARIAGHSG